MTKDTSNFVRTLLSNIDDILTTAEDNERELNFILSLTFAKEFVREFAIKNGYKE